MNKRSANSRRESEPAGSWVRVSTAGAVATARRLSDLLARDLERIHAAGRAAGSAAKVHNAYRERPLWTIGRLKEATGLPVPTVTRAMAATQALRDE